MSPSKTHSKIKVFLLKLHSSWEGHQYYELRCLRSPLGLPGSPDPPDASQMSPRCLPNVSRMPPRCLPDASDASQMSPRCLPDVSQMLPNQFNSNQIESNQINSIKSINGNQMKSIQSKQIKDSHSINPINPIYFDSNICLGSYAWVIPYEFFMNSLLIPY